MSPIKYKKVVYKETTSQLKILAILGDRKGGGSKEIDIEEDKKILKEQLPDATIEFLIETTRKQLQR